MTQPAVSRTGEQAPPATSTTAPATRERLTTGEGQISVAEGVVQKIAGKACREMGGVHAMGTSGSRMFGTIRERIPGSTGPNFSQGVGVEVGETEAAVDLDIVVEYGVSIAELGRSIQRNVKQAVERMTGLRVVEVNIAVDDVYLPGDGDDQIVFRGARFGGLFGFRQREFQRRLLFEGGGDHHENQQHDQNVDQRNDYDRRRLSAFTDRELHGQSFSLWT